MIRFEAQAIRFSQEPFRDRVRSFITAFQAMDEGSDMLIFCGSTLDGGDNQQAAVIIELDDDKLFGFTCEQARIVAALAEEISDGHECSKPGCAFRGFRGLIYALRQSADEVELEFKQGKGRLH